MDQESNGMMAVQGMQSREMTMSMSVIFGILRAVCGRSISEAPGHRAWCLRENPGEDVMVPGPLNTVAVISES